MTGLGQGIHMNMDSVRKENAKKRTAKIQNINSEETDSVSSVDTAKKK